jgi:hypothetical protein
MMMAGQISPRPCCLLLISTFYLVFYTSICSAFPVIPHQQAQFTERSSTKQGCRFPRRVFRHGDAATLRTTNTQTTRSTVHPPPPCWTLSRLSSSFRNQDDKDDVSINVIQSTTSNNDIQKQEYQAQVEEMQRQRRASNPNVKSSLQTLVRIGILCFFVIGGLTGFIMTLKGEN